MLAYIGGKYVSGKKFHFLQQFEQDILYFWNNLKQDSLLVFPHFLPQYRWLGHKYIEKYCNDLCSFSIGEASLRRIVITGRNLFVRKSEVMSSNEKSSSSCVNTSSCLLLPIHDDFKKLSKLSPKHSGKQKQINAKPLDERSKSKRPDKLLYVPPALTCKKDKEHVIPQEKKTKENIPSKNVQTKKLNEIVDALSIQECDSSNVNFPNESFDLHNKNNSCQDYTNSFETEYLKNSLDNISQNELHSENAVENDNEVINKFQCILTKEFLSQPTKSNDSDSNVGINRNVSHEVHTLKLSSVNNPLSTSVRNSKSQKAPKNSIHCDSVHLSDVDTSKISSDDSWDSMFNDQGECLDPRALEELTAIIGNKEVFHARNNYLDFKIQDCEEKNTLDEEHSHIVELFDFPAEFSTQDLVSALSNFNADNYTIKWVDDSHALAIFLNPFAAAQAIQLDHPFVKVRPLSQGLHASKLKAKQCSSSSELTKQRPATSATLARRLVTGALGLKANVSREQKEKERQKIVEAKAQRQEAAKQRKNMWDGVLP